MNGVKVTKSPAPPIRYQDQDHDPHPGASEQPRSSFTPRRLLALVLLLTILTWQYLPTSTRTGVSTTARGRESRLLTVSNYSVVAGVFRQDEPDFEPEGYDSLEDGFGLLDKGEGMWRRFAEMIARLTDRADHQTTYKVFFLARHGEGYHNVAEERYGTEAWNCHWSKLNGDGNLTWGPDPLLTSRGEEQVHRVNQAWKREIAVGAPVPEKFYSSPLRRALSTLQITWGDILRERQIKPVVLENLRETIGVHTCDKRSNRTLLEDTYPNFHFPLSFSPSDPLWNPAYQETHSQLTLRLRLLLNHLFAEDGRTYISITAHNGVIQAFFDAVGHRSGRVGVAGVVPVIVKAVSAPNATMAVIVGGQSATAPACIATATIGN